MRIYISGQISNLEKSDYMERFAKVENELIKKGYSVINPAKVNAQLPKDTTHEEYMKVSLCMLDMCDSIYMLKGWEHSLGANEEFLHAVKTKKIIIYEG